MGYTYASYTYDEETMDPVSIVGPWGNDWMFLSPEAFGLQYPEWFDEFQSTVGEGDMEDDKEGEEPFWYNFIVQDDKWAVLATYSETYEVFYVWTPEDQVCKLTPDWKSDDPMDGIWGFYVGEEDGYSCKYYNENNWTYASYSYVNETGEPISLVGPWGGNWTFVTPEDFEYLYPDWWDVFNQMMRGEREADGYECSDDMEYADDYGDDCEWYADNSESCGEYDSGSYTAFDACCVCGGGGYEEEDEVAWEGYLVDPYGSGDYAYLWLEDEEMTEVYYWNDADSAYCVLIPDWKDGNDTEGEIWGFFVTDPYDMCPYVDQGWTYSWYQEDEYSEYG